MTTCRTCLILVLALSDDKLGHEVADEGVSPEGRHVGPDDGVHLTDEGLDEDVQATEL